MSNGLDSAIECFNKGCVVVFPTDTVYGLGCRIDSTLAQVRIRRIKTSRQNFPVLIANLAQAHQLAVIDPAVEQLVNKYWPGGLTIIVKSRKPGEKIGLRMPNSKLITQIIERIKSPIIGTSANFHGQIAPKSFEELDPKLTKQVDFVLKGECENKVESTVVDTTSFPYKILRSGAIKIDGIVH